MSDFAALRRALESPPGLGLADLRVVRGNELHCSIRPADVPRLARTLRTAFGAELILLLGGDRRADLGCFQVHYLFARARDDWFVHATAAVSPGGSVPSLATFHYPASRLERELLDMFGVPAAGHPDPRRLVRHGFWPEDYHPLRKDAGSPVFQDDGQAFPFQRVAGEGVYEIPVGPVHAGIIEPGHFRFSVVGETIIDMKSRLYFTHKGTEKLFEGRVPAAGVELAERISGDTSVGHALAYCQAVEALAGVEIPRRARYLRVIALELERLYNHVGDVGMILNDTGFAVAHAHCFRIRERLLRLNKRLTGHRLLRGVLVPGGVRNDWPAGAAAETELREALQDFEEVVELSLQNGLVLDRLQGTGQLSAATARDQGTVGFVARASGLDVDTRRDHPFAAYPELSFRVPVLEAGDVQARMLCRVEEAREAVAIIGQAIAGLPGGALAAPVGTLPAGAAAFGLVEGWRGRIVHWVMADPSGLLARVKVLDPSFLNWPALSHALLRNIVPDFPLCNKSFNQSYSGNDL